MQRNSISPTEREKYRNARSPMSSGDPHAPDMKKIKREDKDGHVIKTNMIKKIVYIRSMAISVTFFLLHMFFLCVSSNLFQMSDGERSDQDLVVDDGGDVRDI